MITIQNIAERAGVNKGTVSYVLNGKHKKARIGAETCTRIKAIAKELGYRRNELARSVATGKSNVIAFVSCDTGFWEYVGKIMAGILEEITKQNFSLKVYHLSGKNSLDIAEQIIKQRADGVIFHSPDNTDFQLIHEEMKKHHIPCATTNLSSKTACIGVTTDDFHGIKEAVRHLVELGHQRILCFSHQYSGHKAEYIAKRKAAYLAGLKEYIGKSAKPRIEVLPQNYSENKIIIESILNEPPEQRPTAIICISDADAMEVLQAAYQIGIRIPEELSVVGFADLEMAKYAMVPLTTIAQPFEQMGKETANMLLDIVKNKNAEMLSNVKNRKLKVNLVIRKSTAPPVKVND
jgi:DNA-binding LacI/PurR family transcriptional regulator